jgi:hypothetical protein
VLGRYRMVRGRRPADEPLPEGVRQDTRKHTRHVLRPEAAAVEALLAELSEDAWQAFAASYRALLEARAERAPEALDELARLAREGDLWLGCSCPTARNPDVRRCHTVLAIEFMSRRYPDLEVRWPDR